MTQTATKPKGKSKLDRTPPLRGAAKEMRVDRKQKAIFGYAVISKRVIEDMRGWEIDDKTLDQTIELGNANKRGLKSRFTHPNMSGDGLGTFLGRAKNFRRDGDVVRADLHFADSAFHTPNGDLAGYLLELAEEDPEAFGSSIAFLYELEVRLNEDGTRKRDKEDNPLPPLLRLQKLYATDIVDTPAATDGLFSDESMRDWPARQATAALDKLFGNDPPDVVRSRVDDFLNRYFSNKGNGPMTDAKTAEATKAPETTTPPAKTAEATFSQADVDAAAKKAADEAALAEQKRQTDINALCKQAGMPEKADAFCADRQFSVPFVREQLFSAMCAKNAAPKDDAAADTKTAKDPDANFKAEYAAGRAEFERQEISEADYVASRRVDEGLSILAPKKPE